MVLSSKLYESLIFVKSLAVRDLNLLNKLLYLLRKAKICSFAFNHKRAENAQERIEKYGMNEWFTKSNLCSAAKAYDHFFLSNLMFRKL